MANKDQLIELANELSVNVSEKLIIESFFNEIRVIVQNDTDKEICYKEVSSVLNELAKGETKKIKLKVMYHDEYPDGFSPERAIVKSLSEKFSNTLNVWFENGIVIVVMNIDCTDEDTDVILLSLIKEKYHIYRQIYREIPFRKRDVKINLRLGITSFDFVINMNNSIRFMGYDNLSNFSASIVYYLYKLGKNKFHKINSDYFTSSNEAFINALDGLAYVSYIEVQSYHADDKTFKIKLLD